jgi:hypothetical protein
MNLNIPVQIINRDAQTLSVSGTLEVSETSIDLQLNNGQSVAIEYDETGIRVFVWVEDHDAPVSLTLSKQDSIYVESEDFQKENGKISFSK